MKKKDSRHRKAINVYLTPKKDQKKILFEIDENEKEQMLNNIEIKGNIEIQG